MMTEPNFVATRLEQLALNLWWTWHPEIAALFRSLDPARWEASNHNPVDVLHHLTPGQVFERVDALGLGRQIDFWYHRLQDHLADDVTWCQANGGALGAASIAYFSAEFGIHEALPLYSGGLGTLAGDHVKTASDLGLPLVGVGLFYARGYFHQHVDEYAWQREDYGRTDLARLPLVRAAAHDGSALTISVPCGATDLHAAVWLAHVGRVRLLLLDSDVPQNSPQLRELTAVLYGGDEVVRIRQEILLGIGGLRALRAIGFAPTLLHLNEGHSAFAILERMRERVQEDGVSFAEAARTTAIQTVFTTHTPVEAGHDRFHPALIEDHLGWLPSALGTDLAGMLALGRLRADDANEPFTMTILGLRNSRQRNGVSHLHGHVSRRMWRALWPSRTEEDVPITHITNGVHVGTWLAASLRQIFELRLGAAWAADGFGPDAWSAIAQVPDDELWEAHGALRHDLVRFARQRTGHPEILDPECLTIGFARRFATYKRATLILADLERLAQWTSQENRPVQLIFAGKAHPRDDAGKTILQHVVRLTRDPKFARRCVFLEDYDMNVARRMVQGVDVWLNTPLRPLEASGTSGQKAATNGVLNLSILDGWWAEAYDGFNGFAVGSDRPHVDPAIQAGRDAASLYQVLEHEVIPLFYERDGANIPRRWLQRMKHSLATLGWRFSASRMVEDYVTTMYLPAVGATSAGRRMP